MNPIGLEGIFSLAAAVMIFMLILDQIKAKVFSRGQAIETVTETEKNRK